MSERRFKFEEDPKAELKNAVNSLIQRERLVLDFEERQNLDNEIEESDRFIAFVSEKKEDGGNVKRFVKVPALRSTEVMDTFKRQVDVTKFLNKEGALRTEKLIDYKTDFEDGWPFMVAEAINREAEETGFDHHGEHLDQAAAVGFAETLQKLHSIDMSRFPMESRSHLAEFPEKYEEMRDEIMEVLEQKVNPMDGKENEPFHKVLGRRLEVKNFKDKVRELLKALEPLVKKAEKGKEVLVHGNLDPGNAYVRKNGEVELVDFEFTGTTHNEILGAMVDFGNLRARVWNNKNFRDAFDNALLGIYRKQGREEVGRAIVSLGILRSHAVLAGFFENYEHERQVEEEQIQRRDATEQDIKKAWAVAGIEFKIT